METKTRQMPKTGGEHKFLIDMYGNEVTLFSMQKGNECIQVYANEIECMMLEGFELTSVTRPRKLTIVN